jgi:hypothetical protein
MPEADPDLSGDPSENRIRQTRFIPDISGELAEKLYYFIPLINICM